MEFFIFPLTPKPHYKQLFLEKAKVNEQKMKMGPDLLFNPFEDFHGPHIGLFETSSQKTTKVKVECKVSFMSSLAKVMLG